MYTDPAPQDIKARFPELAEIPDTRIAFVIEEAVRHVDQSWTEKDYAPAIRFLVAHLLMSEGALNGGGAAGIVGPLLSDTLGDASQTYANYVELMGLRGSDAELGITSYGRRFLALRRANRPSIMVV